MIVADRLGLTLLHFLWQGAVISAVYAGIHRGFAAKWKPNSRYVLGCVALAAMMCTPALTFLAFSSIPGPESVGTADRLFVATRSESSGAVLTFPHLHPSTMSGGNALTWVVVAWFIGVCGMCVRFAGAWFRAERTVSAQIRPAPPEWQTALLELGRRIGVRRQVLLKVSGRVDAPTVIGWLRPAVLVPVGLLAGMPSEQVEALLSHELAHIRRHDYVVNIVQSVAEALLFYHPGVWWISGQIRRERELCCDDIAVSLSTDVLTYANALATLEISRQALNSHAVAANGGALENRIGRLLGEPSAVSPRGLRSEMLVAALLAAVAASVLFAQSQAAFRFQAVSIQRNFSKANDTVALRNIRNPGSVDIYPGGRLTAGWVVVRALIQRAYGLEPFQVGRGPDWIDTEHYDVIATGPAGTSREQMQLALQFLLQERFKLKTHYETIDVPVYVLRAARQGLKLPGSGSTECGAWGALPPPPPPPNSTRQPPVCGRVQVSLISATEARLTAGSVTMADLTADLSNILGFPVIDRTGFTGKFDLDVSFFPDRTLAGLVFSAAAASPNDSKRSILAALEDQVGLNLELSKGPTHFLAIESIERPTN